MLLPKLCEMTIMCKVEQKERRKGRESPRAFLPKRMLGSQGGFFMKKILAAIGVCAAICALGATACAETAETASVEFTASAETAATAESETAAETADTADETASTAEVTTAETDGAESQSPATGVEGIAFVAGTAIAAGGIMLVASKKR